MREAAWFSKAKGFLIGRPLHFGEAEIRAEENELEIKYLFR